MEKRQCEICGFIDDYSSEDDPHADIFTHHSGLKVCADCAEKVEKETYETNP